MLGRAVGLVVEGLSPGNRVDDPIRYHLDDLKVAFDSGLGVTDGSKVDEF